MSDWRDTVGEELTGFGLGDLEEDGTLTVTFQEDGEMVDTQHGEAYRAHVTVTSHPEGYTDMEGEGLEDGEDYYLMSSSSRFLRALMQQGNDLSGLTVDIQAEGDNFDRTYSVE